MTNILLKRLRNESGDSILTMALISTLFVALLVGFALDVSKNAMLRSNYSTMAQQSVETGVKTINSNGSLNANTPIAVYNEYIAQRNPSPSELISSNETTPYQDGACRVVTVNGVEHTAPYIVLTLDSERGSGIVSSSSVTYYIEADGSMTTSDTFNNSVKYKVVTATVYDTAENIILGMFGMPCQQFASEVSATTFRINTDV